MSKLLDVAKNIKTIRPYKVTMSDDETNLALAWARGELTIKQVSGALFPNKKTSPSGVYIFLAHAFRYYVMKK